MLIDLLSTANHGSYNISVANIFGLEAAIYWEILVDINQKAIRKGKTFDDFFKLERKYIVERTTLDTKKQKELEEIFINIGALERHPDDSNLLKLNINTLCSILISEDESLLGNIKELSVPKKKKTKAEATIDTLIQKITATNEELIKAYIDWINAVMARQGWMSARSVTVGQKIIDEYSNRDLDIALAVIDVAATHGYRDMTWAINKYEEELKKSSKRVYAQKTQQPTKVDVSEEVF